MKFEHVISVLVALAIAITLLCRSAYNNVNYDSPAYLQKLQAFITDRISSHNYNENMELANIAYKRKDYKLAEFLCTYAIRQKQNSYEAYYFRAKAKLEQDDYYNAKSDLKTALKLNPQLNIDNQFRQSLLKKQLVYAASLLITDDSYNGEDNSMIIKIRCENAVRELDDVIKYQPNNYDAYFYRAIAKKELKDFNSALQDFHYSLRLKPNNPDVYFELGELYLDIVDYKENQSNQSQPIHYHPEFNKRDSATNTEVNQDENLSVKYRNEYLNALKNYNIAIALDKNFKEAYFNRGLTKWNMKDYKGAIQDFSTVIKLNPSDKDAYESRAEVFADYVANYKKTISSSILNQIRKIVITDYAYANDLTTKDAEIRLLFDEDYKHIFSEN